MKNVLSSPKTKQREAFYISKIERQNHNQEIARYDMVVTEKVVGHRKIYAAFAHL